MKSFKVNDIVVARWSSVNNLKITTIYPSFSAKYYKIIKKKNNIINIESLYPRIIRYDLEDLDYNYKGVSLKEVNHYIAILRHITLAEQIKINLI